MNIETDGRALLETRLPEVKRAVRSVSRRFRLNIEDGQELYSLTLLKLIQEDHAVLRAFTGHSSWSTYLNAVAGRVWLDHRNRELGKWRPSAKARRLGPTAVLLDRCINRDGLTPREAIHRLKMDGEAQSADQLWSWVGQLPHRRVRRMVPLEPDMASTNPTTGGLPWERRRVMLRLRAVLRSAFQDLSDQERHLLRLRFAKSWTVRKIANQLDAEPRSLYRKFQKIFCHLRKSIESTGLDWDEIRQAWDLSVLELQADLLIASQATGKASVSDPAGIEASGADR